MSQERSSITQEAGPPNLFEEPANHGVLRYLKNLSAHSDVVEDLTKAVEPLDGVEICCPDASHYRYVTVSKNGVIFGFAVGMQVVGLRVGTLFEQAVATGAERPSEAGDEWVTFTLGGDGLEVDLKFWARQAYLLTNRGQQQHPLPHHDDP